MTRRNENHPDGMIARGTLDYEREEDAQHGEFLIGKETPGSLKNTQLKKVSERTVRAKSGPVKRIRDLVAGFLGKMLLQHRGFRASPSFQNCNKNATCLA